MRIAVTGAGGQLGFELARALERHEAVLLDQAMLDVTDEAACSGVLSDIRADVVIHAAAWTDVDGCERQPERAHAVNVQGTRNVVRAAGTALTILISTDYVFDGALGRAYAETDVPAPVQVYGETKAAAEQELFAASDRVAVARSAWLYGSRVASGARARNFVTTILEASKGQGVIEVVDDQVGSPTSACDLARALVSICERGTTGVFHVVNAGAVSRYELARAVFEHAGLDPARVRAVATADAPARAARRPSYAPLETSAWRAAGHEPLADWDDALARGLAGILAGW